VLSDFFEIRHIDVLVRKIAKHFLSALQRKECDEKMITSIWTVFYP